MLCRKALHKEVDLFNPGPTLDQFLCAFHGCYKDGTGGGADNNIDCRWFAGLYFLLRLILFLVFAFTPTWFLQYIIQQMVCIIALLFFVIFRPYKNQLFNIVDACIFANLTAILSFSMYNFYFTRTRSVFNLWSFVIQYILIFLPLLYMIVYMLYILWRKYSHVFFRKKSMEMAEGNEDESFLEFADQEERYRNICGSYQKRISVSNRRKSPACISPSSVQEKGASYHTIS